MSTQNENTQTHLSTVSEAIAALEREGYVGQFSIEEDGAITSDSRTWQVDDITVDQTFASRA